MTFITRRLSVAFIAAAVIGSMAVEPAFAQYTPGAPTVGPAGGVSSTTAPSNSQGTPAGGTGTLSTTRVGPSGATTAATGDAPAVSARPSRHRRHELRRARHHRRHHRAAETGTQSQDGTNGAMPPASR